VAAGVVGVDDNAVAHGEDVLLARPEALQVPALVDALELALVLGAEGPDEIGHQRTSLRRRVCSATWPCASTATVRPQLLQEPAPKRIRQGLADPEPGQRSSLRATGSRRSRWRPLTGAFLCAFL